ncbi:hypothetical protein GL982_05655 [Spiroplasma citri]|uniref:Uncharacterized protein n=3 Tax=Spiroplasma citri TaxID=2133 RepID=A0AAJ4EK25_SPICI|nr:hypothetical protein [Spiroplasma citri]APE75118.1 putative lipoprotein [Spiroplasma citri]QIA69226.1 hypothetical protein GL298_06790 [Spiroplasma citri]QIA71092.1 hypothetical protein GL981_06840 [Spiroplasma citri]QIA73138.1 hypothetical protein GL982_05655 [Spiroplasma citri]QIA75263.1 hypothetical protein GTU57_06095 [Spiroplasma citri]
MDWTTNDLTKIITLISLPYSEEAVDKPADPARVLAVMNVLNGTNFTSDDVEVIVEDNNYKIIAKEGGNFTGELEIISEAVTFDQVYPVVNLGNVYLASDIYNNWKKDPTGSTLIIAAALMEFSGDPNRFSAFYSQAIMQAFMQGGILDINIDDQLNGTFYLSGSVPNIFNDSNVTFKFHVILDHRKYLNYNNEKPKNMEQIKVTLNETYTGNNLNDIRYAVVKQLLGQFFAEQYKDLWYDELLVDKPYNTDKKEIVFRAKPGSKILASSDKMASILTKQPFYQIIATLQEKIKWSNYDWKNVRLKLVLFKTIFLLFK